MGAIGKFLLGSAVVGAVAAGVYYYLDKNSKEYTAEGEEEPRNGADTIRNAADRAYTTIRRGTDEALTNVKKTVGPKGSEVIDVVGDAAGKVRDVVVDSAGKVKDIVTSRPEGQDIVIHGGDEEPQADAAADTDENTGAAEPEAEKAEAEAPAAAEAADAPEEKDSKIEVTEDPDLQKKADEVEEFFDDDDPQNK